MQKEQEKQTLEFNKGLNKEIFDHNSSQRAIKDAILAREKAMDKQMVNDQVMKEQMLDQLERDAKVSTMWIEFYALKSII